MQQRSESKAGDQAALERLALLIRQKTESFYDDSLRDRPLFQKFPSVLESTYARAMEVLELIPLGELALVYRWSGSDPSLDPVLFMGHYDVVGANDGEWSVPPFAGEIRDGFLYGRGTQDIKCHLGGYMEAVTLLADQGFVPRRTLYFAFGGDEEVAGLQGAGRISAWFREQGIRFHFVLDEGGVISTDGLAAFSPRPAALIGIAEKGMASFRIVCRGQSGHSSMPPAHTAVGNLSRAVCRLEARPSPLKVETSVRRLFREVAPHSRGILGLILRLYPLTSGLLKAAFAAKPSTAALVRTTRAVTMVGGGTRENVLPDRAEAVVNFRIIPGETVDSVRKELRKRLKGLPVTVEDYEGWPASDPVPAPETETEAYRLLAGSIREVFPEVLPLPFLMVGSTDSKQFRDLSGDIFRFTPIFISNRDLERVHGVDERISLENYQGMIRFYCHLIKKSCSSAN